MAVSVEIAGTALSGKPSLGDLLYIERDGFSTWAAYVGSGRVVRFGAHSLNKKNTKIEEKNFISFAKDAIVNNGNFLDGVLMPLPDIEIVRRAYGLMRYNSYTMINFNSQNLANYCRYGMTVRRPWLQYPLRYAFHYPIHYQVSYPVQYAIRYPVHYPVSYPLGFYATTYRSTTNTSGPFSLLSFAVVGEMVILEELEKEKKGKTKKSKKSSKPSIASGSTRS